MQNPWPEYFSTDSEPEYCHELLVNHGVNAYSWLNLPSPVSAVVENDEFEDSSEMSQSQDESLREIPPSESPREIAHSEMDLTEEGVQRAPTEIYDGNSSLNEVSYIFPQKNYISY